MKKLSISLFAILAIAVAVFSAFTTQPRVKKATSQGWFLYDLRSSVNQTYPNGQTTDFTKYSTYTGANDPITDDVCLSSSTNSFVCGVLLDPDTDVDEDVIQSVDEIAFEIE